MVLKNTFWLFNSFQTKNCDFPEKLSEKFRITMIHFGKCSIMNTYFEGVFGVGFTLFYPLFN